jgi:hypothetical protein
VVKIVVTSHAEASRASSPERRGGNGVGNPADGRARGGNHGMPEETHETDDPGQVPLELLRLLDAFRARKQDAVMRLRSVPLQYSPTYLEPLTALRWIENGGRNGA